MNKDISRYTKTIDQAAKEIGVNSWLIHSMVMRGQLTVLIRDQVRWIDPDELVKVLDRNQKWGNRPSKWF